MTPTRFPRGLYGVTPNWADTDRLLQAIQLAHAGGMSALQWRRKGGTPAERHAQAQAILDLCRQLALPLIINDDWQLAAQLDADGVHLGKDDAPVAQVRQALGPQKLIGCSCYNQVDLARQRLQDNIDYIAFGALYPSAVKPDAVQATLADLQAGRELTLALNPRPAVVAIGGIGPSNAAPVIQAGADSIAVISAIFEAPDIRAAAQACSDLFS